jgi:uncharacterized protein
MNIVMQNGRHSKGSWFVLFVIAGVLAFMKIPFHKLFELQFGVHFSKQIETAIHCLVIIPFCFYLIQKLQLSDLAGTRLLQLRKPIFLLIPFVYPMALAIPQVLDVNAEALKSVTAVATMLIWILQATSEEVLFRGFVQSTLIRHYGRSHSITSIVIASAVLFGLAHLINLARLSYLDVLNQVVFATCFGVLMGALLLNVQNVWVLGLIHGFINIFFGMEEIIKGSNATREITKTAGIQAVIVYTLIALPVLIIGLLILKPIAKQWKSDKSQNNNLQATPLTPAIDQA